MQTLLRGKAGIRTPLVAEVTSRERHWSMKLECISLLSSSNSTLAGLGKNTRFYNQLPVVKWIEKNLPAGRIIRTPDFESRLWVVKKMWRWGLRPGLCVRMVGGRKADADRFASSKSYIISISFLSFIFGCGSCCLTDVLFLVLPTLALPLRGPGSTAFDEI